MKIKKIKISNFRSYKEILGSGDENKLLSKK